MNRLSTDRLTFAYAGPPLFDAWSHAFAPGLTWMRGTNGSGKSTLLKLLAGALTPHAGRIVCGDIDVASAPVDYRRHVHWCDIDDVAFDRLTPFEFLGCVASRHPTFDTALPSTLVDTLGLAPFLERRIHQLSTGSRRKLAVIAAIAAGSDVVLLDEPLAALDRASATVVRAHLATVARQRARTWVVTSHEPLDDSVPFHVVDLPSRG